MSVPSKVGGKASSSLAQLAAKNSTKILHGRRIIAKVDRTTTPVDNTPNVLDDMMWWNQWRPYNWSLDSLANVVKRKGTKDDKHHDIYTDPGNQYQWSQNGNKWFSRAGLNDPDRDTPQSPWELLAVSLGTCWILAKFWEGVEYTRTHDVFPTVPDTAQKRLDELKEKYGDDLTPITTDTTECEAWIKNYMDKNGNVEKVFPKTLQPIGNGQVPQTPSKAFVMQIFSASD
jgi:hypothetical protein